MASGTPWPHLLADLTAKRDALTGLIDTIRLHFHNDADPSTMPESPIVRPRGSTPPKRSTKKAKAGKRDGTGREQTSRQRAPRSLPDGEKKSAGNGTSRAGMATPATADVVQARDAAVLARLKRSPAKYTELRGVMPNEGHDDDRAKQALSNTLTRLRLKKQIKQTPDGAWIAA